MERVEKHRGTVEKPDGTVSVLTPLCRVCHQYGAVEMTSEQYGRYISWKSGQGPIQNLLYDFEAPIREALKTGYHPECWDLMLGEEQ